ncbi:hypothetical protein MRX96_020589 [Rhipicephalus microplus]
MAPHYAKFCGPLHQAAVANHGRSGSHQGTKNHPVQLKSLSGLKLTVACLKGYFYGHNQDSCYHPLAWDIFELLKKNCNVSIDFVKLTSGREMLFGTISHKWDVAYVIALLYNVDVLVFDIPFIVIDHETFFSRKSAHRTVALSEVGRECWRLAVATITNPSSGHLNATYLRSELTSIVTLRRPAESIDTLEKLENALDRAGHKTTLTTRDFRSPTRIRLDPPEKSPSVLVADVSSTTVVVHKGPEEQVARDSGVTGRPA